MNLSVQHSGSPINKSVEITGSKSESNRLLLLQALYPNVAVNNVSNSDDSKVMRKAVEDEKAEIVDIHHAGTAMRFLTAFFSVQEGREVLLTGSSRMKQRPIQILVDALRQLGANISYEENEGMPPLRIRGKELAKNKVSLAANVSSQYISALLLIAPKLPQGLELTLEGKITSVPYIKMTLSLLDQLGIETQFEGNKIQVFPKKKVEDATLTVESDWSSASYFYSIAALSDVGTEITLSSYKENSLQGDSSLAQIYQEFGVTTSYNENTITLRKETTPEKDIVECHLENAPDIAQTIAVTCFGLHMGCDLYGLHTLPIKETDRLAALQTELTKLGATVSITDESLHLTPSTTINEGVDIDTYQDHRMAMAFAPLGLKTQIIINEAEVVSKSYPDYWKDLEALGFTNKEL